MVTATLCPAGIVTGRFNPIMANSELFDWSDETVTAAFEAVSVAVRLALDPTVMFPKLRLGVIPSCAGVELGGTPVPVNCARVGEFAALLKNAAWADAVPEALGVN